MYLLFVILWDQYYNMEILVNVILNYVILLNKILKLNHSISFSDCSASASIPGRRGILLADVHHRRRPSTSILLFQHSDWRTGRPTRSGISYYLHTARSGCCT